MSLFTEEDFTSDTYRWRRAGKGTMVHIFHQQSQLGKFRNSNQSRKTLEDQFGYHQDIDALYLKTFFEKEQERYFPAGITVSCNPIKSFEDTMKILTTMDSEKAFAEHEKFDCFMFVFLTFAEVDGRLHFNDKTSEKGLVPLENIVDVVKKLQVARGKPKIFIIQSDDMTLSEEKKFEKGEGFVTKYVKIATDADRLIIQSTIPQAIVKSLIINGEKREESLLIQAFVEAIRENAEAREKEDFFTMTTTINQKIRCMKEESDHPRKSEMPVALVTSTLTKRLNFHDSATVE